MCSRPRSPAPTSASAARSTSPTTASSRRASPATSSTACGEPAENRRASRTSFTRSHARMRRRSTLRCEGWSALPRAPPHPPAHGRWPRRLPPRDRAVPDLPQACSPRGRRHHLQRPPQEDARAAGAFRLRPLPLPLLDTPSEGLELRRSDVEVFEGRSAKCEYPFVTSAGEKVEVRNGELARRRPSASVPGNLGRNGRGLPTRRGRYAGPAACAALSLDLLRPW